MEVTWIAILASLCMGIGAALVFVFAVKKNYFKDVEEMVDSTERRDPNEEVEDDEKSG
jgi:hypothetical protein